MWKDQARSSRPSPFFGESGVSPDSGWLWPGYLSEDDLELLSSSSISWTLGWQVCIARPGFMWCWRIKCRNWCVLDKYATISALKLLLQRHFSHLWAHSSYDLYLPKTQSIKTTYYYYYCHHHHNHHHPYYYCTCAHVSVQVGMRVPLCIWRLEDDFGESSSPFTLFLLRPSLYFCCTKYSRLASQ